MDEEQKCEKCCAEVEGETKLEKEIDKANDKEEGGDHESEEASPVGLPDKQDEGISQKVIKQTDIDNREVFSIGHDEDITVSNDCWSDLRTGSEPVDDSSVMLLRGTVNELERALRDSRALLKTRDDEIVTLRKEVERGRDQIHKEQLKWQRKCAVVEERGRKIQDLTRRLQDSEKANEDLAERIKEYESPHSESDDIIACCSAMHELIEVKMELSKKDEMIEEIRKNNSSGVKAIAASGGWSEGASVRDLEKCDEHHQLKLKFLRDAFFYFMIDFHSDEQIKAILAVLAYGDQRESVILQAYHMRQRGKRFTVKEVSSRNFSFLHEETL